MDDASKITSEVNRVEEAQFKDLRTRQDKDFDRWVFRKEGARGSFEYQVSLKARDTDIAITSNSPRTFADNVQSILSASDRQIVVRMAEAEGEDKRDEIGKLERLLEFAFYKADERLIALLQPTLKESLVWYSIVRGWLAGRFLVYKRGGNVIFDFLPYDPRWLTFQRGANGLLWTASTTSRSAEELEDEYGKVVRKSPWYKPWQKEKSNYPVIDYWKREGENKFANAVICDNVFIKDPETYDMKSMPVLIAPVATRPPIQGKDRSEMEGYGESIFAPNREIDDLLNKLASMWASHANLLSKQPIVNYIGPNGKTIKDTLHYAGGVINLPAGENKLDEVPMKEISVTLVNLVNWAESKRVGGALPDIDIGKPPPSGTLYNLVQETSNRVYNPQVRNLSSFYGSICRLVEEQLVMGGVGGEKIRKVKAQGEIKNKYYEVEVTPIDLKKPHIIRVEFTARTPWSQLDTAQVADMLKRSGIPDRWIWEHIYKFPDPKLIDDLAVLEIYEHSPEGLMKRSVEVLMKHGYVFEAEKLIKKLELMEMQEEMQVLPQEGAEPTEEPIPPEIAG